MAKQSGSKILSFIAWFTGVVVSLAVGFSMIGDGALNQSIPYLSAVSGGLIITIVGWIVVATTLIGVVLALLKR